MKITILFFVLSLSAYFRKATTDAETVWLKDLTTGLQTDKRGFTGHGLPDQLSILLQRKTHGLILNLKRNYHIDPNTDIYIVQQLKDGQPLLEKMHNLENVDVAYYQDIDNGAFMTARCVKRSGGQCDILINGNVQLGDRSYYLRPSNADVIPNIFMKSMDLHGRQYVLHDEAYIQSGMSIENNEQTNSIEKNVQDKHINHLRSNPYGQGKTNLNINPDVMFSNINGDSLPTGNNDYSRTINKNDKSRNLDRYYVDVVVVADSSVMELFLAIANSTSPSDIYHKATMDSREYLIHIINGVDQLYKRINDSTIEITVTICAIVAFQSVALFPHQPSTVQVQGTQSAIDGRKYFNDLKTWDINIGSKELPPHDQVILFTRHVLNSSYAFRPEYEGMSLIGSVCDIGSRVAIVPVGDFFITTKSAAHALGHALGARHDGDGNMCRSSDEYIMSTERNKFTNRRVYKEAPWHFSACSVVDFKKTLPNKQCVKTRYAQDPRFLAEMNTILSLQPGQRYSIHEQCVFINGYGSKSFTKILKNVCRFMRCTDPVNTESENKKYYSAATGTMCGYDMHCQKGLCVQKR